MNRLKKYHDKKHTVLIPTTVDDTHTLYVYFALKSLGHKTVLWYTNNFPIKHQHTFSIDNNNKDYTTWHVSKEDFGKYNQEFSVVWNRRPSKPVLSNTIHPDDVENATNENIAFYRSMWHVIAPNAIWINPFIDGIIADCKLQQLKIAKQVRLSFPRTIVSNDPKKIRAFANERVHNGRIIYKTLTPTKWINKDSIRLTYSRIISSNTLPCDNILQLTPGIFQEIIAKAYEVRLTMFGHYPIAIKIFSQKHVLGLTDWRRMPPNELLIEPIEIPENILQNCKLLMERLNLVFGCFDFIVTPDGGYYFLEINEQCQFLWIERLVPTIKVLATFVWFITNLQNASKPEEEFLKTISLAAFTEKVTAKLTMADSTT